MSFQLKIKPSRRTAARFIGKVRRLLQDAVVEEGEKNGLTQSDIARKIGVHRSVISRELNGRSDITMGRLAELAWALNRKIDINLAKVETEVGQNIRVEVSSWHNVESASASSDFINHDHKAMTDIFVLNTNAKHSKVSA